MVAVDQPLRAARILPRRSQPSEQPSNPLAGGQKKEGHSGWHLLSFSQGRLVICHHTFGFVMEWLSRFHVKQQAGSGTGGVKDKSRCEDCSSSSWRQKADGDDMVWAPRCVHLTRGLLLSISGHARYWVPKLRPVGIGRGEQGAPFTMQHKAPHSVTACASLRPAWCFLGVLAFLKTHHACNYCQRRKSAPCPTLPA